MAAQVPLYILSLAGIKVFPLELLGREGENHRMSMWLHMCFCVSVYVHVNSCVALNVKLFDSGVSNRNTEHTHIHTHKTQKVINDMENQKKRKVYLQKSFHF